jgi:hypothetical protein
MRGLVKRKGIYIEKVSELGFSAYEISKEIKLTEAGGLEY